MENIWFICVCFYMLSECWGDWVVSFFCVYIFDYFRQGVIMLFDDFGFCLLLIHTRARDQIHGSMLEGGVFGLEKWGRGLGLLAQILSAHSQWKREMCVKMWTTIVGATIFYVDLSVSQKKKKYVTASASKDTGKMQPQRIECKLNYQCALGHTLFFSVGGCKAMIGRFDQDLNGNGNRNKMAITNGAQRNWEKFNNMQEMISVRYECHKDWR